MTHTMMKTEQGERLSDQEWVLYGGLPHSGPTSGDVLYSSSPPRTSPTLLGTWAGVGGSAGRKGSLMTHLWENAL